MHPIFGDFRRLLLYLAAWLPVAGAVAVLLAFSGSSWTEAAALAVPVVPPFAFACLASWYLCRALPLHDTPLPRLLGTQVAAAALSASLWLLVGREWASFVEAWFAGAVERFTAQTPPLLALGTLLYLLSSALGYMLAAVDERRRIERHALEVKVLAREAELVALRAQLQPHFLFNSLNSISALTTVDAEGARRMCLLLADFLRRSLELGAQEAIPLADELALVSSYLAVEKVRYGHRLQSEEAVDPEARSCRIPSLLLQPLVENAITHGIAHRLEGGTVRMEARRRTHALEIAVTNPRDPDRPRKPGTGLGLENVRRRLLAWYGRDAEMRVLPTADAFRVELRLPLSDANAHE
jgi:two-component system sensor histidine kinase AlgZ